MIAAMRSSLLSRSVHVPLFDGVLAVGLRPVGWIRRGEP